MSANLSNSTSIVSISSEPIILPVKRELKVELPTYESDLNNSSTSISSSIASGSNNLDSDTIPGPNYGIADIKYRFNGSTYIEFPSRFHPGHIFKFYYVRTRSTDGYDCYRCQGCLRVYNRGNCFYKLKRLLVKNGCFLMNPDEPDFPHFCMDEQDSMEWRESEHVMKKDVKKYDNPSSSSRWFALKTAKTRPQKDPKSSSSSMATSPSTSTDIDPFLDPSVPQKNKLAHGGGAIILDDYGPATFDTDPDGSLMMVYTDKEGREFRFSRNKYLGGQKSWNFECEGCKVACSVYKVPFEIEKIKVVDCRIMTTPDVPHICTNYTSGQSSQLPQTPPKRVSKRPSYDEPKVAPAKVSRRASSQNSIKPKRKTAKPKPKTGIVKPIVQPEVPKETPTESVETHRALDESTPVGELIVDTDKFSYIVEIAGYDEDSVKVDLDKDRIVVYVEKTIENGDEEVTKTMTYRRKLPENVDRESIEGEIDDNGKLVVSGRLLQVESERRKVPIGKRNA